MRESDNPMAVGFALSLVGGIIAALLFESDRVVMLGAFAPTYIYWSGLDVESGSGDTQFERGLYRIFMPLIGSIMPCAAGALAGGVILALRGKL